MTRWYCIHDKSAICTRCTCITATPQELAESDARKKAQS